jgi:hypothetical protein
MRHDKMLRPVTALGTRAATLRSGQGLSPCSELQTTQLDDIVNCRPCAAVWRRAWQRSRAPSWRPSRRWRPATPACRRCCNHATAMRELPRQDTSLCSGPLQHIGSNRISPFEAPRPVILVENQVTVGLR